MWTRRSSPSRSFGNRRAGKRQPTLKRIVPAQGFRDQNHQTTPAIAAKKTATPMTMPKFTLVVRLCTFTSGNPLLSFSIDMTSGMDRSSCSRCPDNCAVAHARNVRILETDTCWVPPLFAVNRRHATQVKSFLILESIRRATRRQQGDDDSTDQRGRSKNEQDNDRDGHGIRKRSSGLSHRPSAQQRQVVEYPKLPAASVAGHPAPSP
jgi:hypothetical protein